MYSTKLRFVAGHRLKSCFVVMVALVRSNLNSFAFGKKCCAQFAPVLETHTKEKREEPRIGRRSEERTWLAGLPSGTVERWSDVQE